MALGTRNTNTFAEILRKVHSLLGDAELADDADVDFARELRERIQEYARMPIDNIVAEKLTNVPRPNGAGAGATMANPPALATPMGGPPAGGPGSGPIQPIGGVRPPITTSPEELARILGAVNE